MKLEQFTGEERDAVLKKLKVKKLQASNKYYLKYGRQENRTQYYNAVYKQNSIEK